MVAIWNGFKTVTDNETAWRVSFLVPAVIVFLVAIGQVFLADDCPKGNYKELQAHGAMTRKSSAESAKLVSVVLSPSFPLALKCVSPTTTASRFLDRASTVAQRDAPYEEIVIESYVYPGLCSHRSRFDVCPCTRYLTNRVTST